MAFVNPASATPATPEEKNQAPIAAGGAGVGGSAKASAATPGQNVPAQPSAQLSAYLSANQPQAQAFAGNIANTVGGQISAAGNAINPAVNTYTGQLYTVPTDATVNNTVATAPSTLTPEQTATYQTELGAAQNVPNSANTFESTAPYQGLASNVQNAVQQANLWNSGNNVANLSTALAPFESANATQGGRTLDSLLISQNPGAYNQIRQAVAPAAQLQGQLQSGTDTANTALRNAIQQDVATTTAAQAAPQTYASNLTSYLQNAVDTATQGNTTQNAQILADLQHNTPTQADLQTLGVTPEQWTQLSGYMSAASAVHAPITLSDYLTQTPTNTTAQNIATPTQYADVAALQNLLGANAPTTPINATTANEAGTAPTVGSGNQFNLPLAEANAQFQPLLSQAKAIENAGKEANAQYQINHFGGQSPDQFNQYIASLNAKLKNINAKIAALGKQYPQFGLQNGVVVPGGGGPSAGEIGGTIAAPWLSPSIGIVNPIRSVIGDIGGWLGL